MPDSIPAGADQGDFASFLASSRPLTNRELSHDLRSLTEKVRATGKKGSITLVITVAPIEDDTSVLGLTDEIRVRLPQFPRPGSLGFPDRGGNLRSHPEGTMPLFDGNLDDQPYDTSSGEVPEEGER